jgi:hypothetical protein
VKTIKIINELRCWLEDIKLMYKQCGDSVAEAHFGSVLDRLTYLENMEVEILDEEDEFEDIYSLCDNSEQYNFSSRQTGMTKEDRRLLDSNFKELLIVVNQLIKNQKKIIERLKDE